MRIRVQNIARGSSFWLYPFSTPYAKPFGGAYVISATGLRMPTDIDGRGASRDSVHLIPVGDAMPRLLAVLLIVAFSRALVAQTTASASSITPGARVRITLSDGEQRTGVVVHTATDTLFVRWPQFTNGDVVPLAEISRLEVSTGGQRNLLKGMGVGLLAGATIGTAAGWVGTGSDSFMGRGAMAAAGGVSFGALGLVVGALGALWRGEDWSELSTAQGRLKTGIVPRDHGVGFTVSLRH